MNRNCHHRPLSEGHASIDDDRYRSDSFRRTGSPMRLTVNRGPRKGGIESIMAIAAGLMVISAIGAQLAFGTVTGLLSSFFETPVTLDYLTASPTQGEFSHIVLERGEVESSSNVEVRCEVRGRTSSSGVNILEIVPEGTWVDEGDFLVRLDDSALQTQLIQQQIVGSNSESAVIEARAARDSALLALDEYDKGTFKEQLEKQLSDVFVARENKRRAEEYLVYSKRLASRGYVPEAQLEADAFAVEKADKELKVAETKLEVLKTYTRKKMLTQLTAAIQTTEARLKSRQKTWELDQHQLAEIETNISKCMVYAPAAGQVVYENRKSRSTSTILIEEGLSVRERQVMINLPNPNKMRVVAKVHESRISHVQLGLETALMLDAMPNEVLIGRVTEVSEYPLPSVSVYMDHVKEYEVSIEIDSPPKGLRPGMTAEVRVLVEKIDDALQIPIEAVTERDGVFFCAVPDADGSLQPRQLELGKANETDVIVLDGLSKDEEIVINVTDPAIIEALNWNA